MAVDSVTQSQGIDSSGWLQSIGAGQKAAAQAMPAIFVSGDRVTARPSVVAGYLLPGSDVDIQLPDAAYHPLPGAPRILDIEIGAGGVVVRLGGTEEDLARAIESVYQGDLRELASGASPVWGRGIEPLPLDASVAPIATRISRLSGRSDRDLARLFPGQVHRETYQRWRTGVLENPTPANRRRMGLLVRLVEDLAAREVDVRDWLRSPTGVDWLTPFDLLVEGRFDEVEALAAEAGQPSEPYEVISGEGLPVLAETAPPGFVPRSREPSEDLEFDDDEGWEEIDLDSEGDHGR